jgi:hypothetical protein
VVGSGVGYNANKSSQEFTLDSYNTLSKDGVTDKSGPTTVSETLHAPTSKRNAIQYAADRANRDSGSVAKEITIYEAAPGSAVDDNGETKSGSPGASAEHPKALNSKGDQAQSTSEESNSGYSPIIPTKPTAVSTNVRKRKGDGDAQKEVHHPKKKRLSRDRKLNILRICVNHQHGGCCQLKHLSRGVIGRLLGPYFAPRILADVPGYEFNAKLKEEGICPIYHHSFCCKHRHMSKEEADKYIEDNSESIRRHLRVEREESKRQTITSKAIAKRSGDISD